VSGGYTVTEAGLEQRRAAGFKPTHGARSPTTVARRAAKVQRRFLKEQGLTLAQLDDGFARAALRTYAAAWARCELLDEAPDFRESKERTACGNSARLALADLKERLRELELDRRRPGRALARHLAEHYGSEEGER
jgi:hypothetical protein